MNKLISDIDGGFPFVLDDLRFMDNGIREAFKGTLNWLGGRESNLTDGVILHPEYDLTVDASNAWTVSEFFVFMDGEFYLVPETTLSNAPASNRHYRIVADTSFDSNGLKTFQDASVHDTHQIRRATLELVESAPSWPMVHFTAIYATDSNGWVLWKPNTVQGLLKTDLGISSLENSVATLEADSGAINEAVDTLVDGWKNASQTFINDNITGRSNGDGSGDDAPPNGFVFGSSYLKGKKISNNTVVVDFQIENVTFDTYDTAPVASFVVTGLNQAFAGIVFNGFREFYAVGRADCSSHSQVISNFANIERHPTDTDAIVLSIPAPMNASLTNLNRTYSEDDFGDLTATSSTSFAPTFTFKGQLTIEIF